MNLDLKIIKAEQKEHYELVRNLFKEYAEDLAYTLDIQGFQKEIETLPGEYAAPKGFILLAFVEKKAIGCVALTKLDEEICEMKRMYVRPEFRQKGVGRALAEKTIEGARAIGYKKMWLDMLDSMKYALGLYESMGFVKIKPFRDVSLGGAVFMELNLE
ncbi:MAG: GNAT family N-acetyltransferase [Firmicutes bacterium HGW-Firmicutes-13]|nr:MAG: GNAT family N-acetyltransferase [Firmicutes bacterium HGW-Firmicutes-13]